MKITVQPPAVKPKPIEVDVTPMEALGGIRREFTAALNKELRDLGVHRLYREDGHHYSHFWVKDGKLIGYHEEGRHPRNIEWKHEIEYGVEQWSKVFLNLSTLEASIRTLLPK